MLVPLQQVEAGDESRVGGKALNCARLRRAGFPVPDGLVLLAAANDADVDGIVQHEWFRSWPMDQRFAVRSSGIGEDAAGHSFAGIHETLLNVERSDIASAVRACLASTGSEQARTYRASHGLGDDARAAVLIQPMVDAMISGVAFTVHPVSGAQELVIDAAPGLGDALVSGRIEPDHYRLQKSDGHLIDRTVVDGRTPLSDHTLADLASVLLRIERHYGVPQDVEWAVDAETLWVLQSRPVTPARAGNPAPPTADRDRARAQPIDRLRPDIQWTRANLAEVTPEQTSPQVLGAYEWLLNTTQRRFVSRLLAQEDELGPPFKVFGGRMYFNLIQLCHLGRFTRTPPAAVMRSLGHPEAVRPEDETPPPRPTVGTLLRALPDFVRVVWLSVRLAQLVKWLDDENASSIAELSVDPAKLDDRAVGRLLQAWRVTGPDRMVVVLVYGAMSTLEEPLRKACRAVGEDYDRFVYAQLAAGAPSVTTQQAFDLVEVVAVARQEPAVVAYFGARAEREADYRGFREALGGTRFLKAFDQFLERYGHRGMYESDWSLPRYREDPTPLLFAVRTHLDNPAAESPAHISARLAREADEAWAAFDRKLSSWQRLTVRPRVRALVRRLRQRYVSREYCRSELIKVLYYARQLHLALAGRFVERGWIEQRDDYFFLLGSEIEDVVEGRAEPGTLAAIVAGRRRQRDAEARLRMPLLMRQSDVLRVLAGTFVPVDIEAPAGEDGLTGLCVSRGCIEGEVVVIRDPREFALMRRGAILVAPATDPSWTPLFTLATGVIVEVGGILSHTSTVAREYGLPALANVKHATKRLRTGERVRLDASRGLVTRAES
jgi:pyruvate,water dikinase